MKPDIKGLSLLVSHKKIFKSFAYRSLCKKNKYLSIKKVKVIIFSNFIGCMPLMLYTKPQAHWPFGSKEDDF